jgi:hypothetical protein
LLWLTSNCGGDSPGRKIPTPPAEANSGTDQATVAPTEAVAGPTDPDLSEPAAAEDARVKAAEVLARRMRAGGNPDSNLLPLTLLLALPFAPEIAPAILGADATGAALGARTIAALRTAWPKIKDVVAQLPGFGRSGSNQSGLSFDEFLKEIQPKLNIPTGGEEPTTSQADLNNRLAMLDAQHQSWRYARARDLLALLDPGNEVLKDSDTLANPKNEDVERLHAEIEKQKWKASEIIGDRIERHHNLPTEHQPYFKSAQLDPERFTTYVPTMNHRLKPDGLHTGENHWNKQWTDFIVEHRKANPVEIHEHLLEMTKGLPRWQR